MKQRELDLLDNQSGDNAVAIELAGLIKNRVAALTKAAKQFEKGVERKFDWPDIASGLKLFQDEIQLISTLSQRLDALAATAAIRLERQFLELEARLTEACSKRGWQLTGSWPKLYVEKAVAVEVNQKMRSIAVAGKRIDGANVVSIISALEPVVRDLIPKSFSSKEFINLLAAAYDATRGDKSQLPIFDVYRAFVVRTQKPKFWKDARNDTFTELSIDQFRARLTRALEDGALTSADGRQLRLLPPIDPKDALFLYQPAEARFGYVGRIELIAPTDIGGRGGNN